MIVVVGTVFSAIGGFFLKKILVVNKIYALLAWTSITFVGDSVHMIKDPDNENETIVEEIPRLLIKSWYPWNAMSGMAYYTSLIYQVFSRFLFFCGR